MMINSNNVKYYQLKNTDSLTENNIREIAKLIYNTDPYIYPALFVDEENAQLHISELIRENDSMFCRENLFVAVNNDTIVGIVLWIKGNVVWDSDKFIDCAKKSGAKISQYVDRVNNEYFDLYSNISDDTITIINACVSSSTRGFGIGKQLLDKFICTTAELCDKYELCVIANNKVAVSLYKKIGFSIVEEYNGFTVSNEELPCYKMIRNSKE